MKFYIVIPCHNEAGLVAQTLTSLINQTHLPSKIVVVNDNSTDNSHDVVSAFAKAHSYVSIIDSNNGDEHLPGSKVIQAFNKGFVTLDKEYDVICKFDADLIFPSNYLETLAHIFKKQPKTGIAGGFCYIEKKGNWILENLTNKDHVRGALKAYRKECFEAIGQLKPAMGWDTIDELLSKYHGWDVTTDNSLHVKHLKPTGITYNKEAKHKQGEAFYGMRYGFLLTTIAAAKLAMRKKKLTFFFDYLQGFSKAKRTKRPYLVTEEEGVFIRKLRWKGISGKLSGRKT